MRTAAIGIGSNSLRMLVAEVENGELKRIGRYREGLRVFAALDENGNIVDEMIENACKSVGEFQKEALEKGAAKVHLFSTSAVRDAANQDAFAQALLRTTGMELEVCSGETEANLSFWGAALNEPCGMIDIGGGSTEIVIGNGRSVKEAVSLQMGAVRLHRMKAIENVADALAVVELAREIVLPVQKRFMDGEQRTWIGVGGTFTAGAAVSQRVDWQERKNIHGHVLTIEKVEEMLCLLAPMTLEERLKLNFIQPQRADIVVHGIAILFACMKTLNIQHICVSECGNLEGFLKEKYLFSKTFE